MKEFEIGDRVIVIGGYRFGEIGNIIERVEIGEEVYFRVLLDGLKTSRAFGPARIRHLTPLDELL